MENEPKITERLLPKFSISRPVTVAMILIAVLVIGIIAYTKIKLDLFPAGMEEPYLSIYIPYQDANPKEIEEQIVKPIEGELKTVKDLKRIFSNSSSQGCNFWMEFAQGTNMDLAYAQVTDRLERSRPNIPDEIEYFYIRRQGNDDIPVIFMGITLNPLTADPQYVIDKYVKQAIEGIKGVANVELFGLNERYIQIIVDAEKVKTYRVNLPQVMNSLLRDNFALSSGSVYMAEKKYLLRSKSRFKSLEDIRNIQISPGVRLHHIADVIYDFDEEIHSIMRVDGQVAAGLVAFKEGEANTVEVCERVVEKLELQFSSRTELKGIGYFIFLDQGKLIMESINNVRTTGTWGGIFAFIILFVFLKRLRITLMLTLAIPLSLLVTVLILFFMDWSLNLITLMGLMISIGLVVDNAIVITENIYRFNGLGHDIKKSAVWGASEVGLAIILATLTTVVVFLPLMIMGGDSDMSFILTRLGAPVIFALIASLFIALVFIPVASTRVIPKKKSKIVQPTHSIFTQKYQDILVKILKHRPDALIIILLVIMSQVIPMSKIKRSIGEGGGLGDAFVNVDFPSNYSIEKRDRTLNYISEKIQERDPIYHIDHISTRAQSYRGEIQIFLEPNRDRQWYQVIYRKIANLVGWSDYHHLSRAEMAEDLKKQLPEIPGVKMRTSWRDQGQTDSTIMSFILRGYDYGLLVDLAGELENQIKLVDGVVSVENESQTGRDEIHIQVDREKAFKAGTNPTYLSQVVAFNLRRRKISNYQTPEREIPIYVKSKPEQRQSIAQLRNTFISTDSGNEAFLDSLVDMTFHKSRGNIGRENGKAFLQVRVFSSGNDTQKVFGRVDNILKQFKFPTGYYYDSGEEAELFAEQGEDMAKGLLFSIIFVFLIMGVLFESFILPLSVLIAVPAAFVGSYWLLFITGTTFEIMAGIGMIVLIGVVVNNAIVLIDLINQYRKSGMNREHAILVAGMHRFRPILMTAGTTIGGLLPMAIGNASLIGIPYSPMGITMIGGLISSTFLTLFAVPVFYTYFDDLRLFFKKFIKRF